MKYVHPRYSAQKMNFAVQEVRNASVQKIKTVRSILNVLSIQLQMRNAAGQLPNPRFAFP